MVDTTQDSFMEFAVDQAKIGLAKGFLPIGAVLALNGEIVSANHNQVATNAGLVRHAETLVLQEFDDLEKKPGRRCDADLYTTLEPCMACIGIAANAHIGNIYYCLKADEDGFVEFAREWDKKRPQESRKYFRLPNLMRMNAYEKECRSLFQQFVSMNPKSKFKGWATKLSK